LVVTLLERHEFGLLLVQDLAAQVISHGISWAHLPIRDVDVPVVSFPDWWTKVRADLLGRLDAAGRVLLHCRAGFGRVAALLLIETEIPADAAIEAVRGAQHGPAR
jgi:ADP-ribosyl-[dinitrogen reductase] hydrolase